MISVMKKNKDRQEVKNKKEVQFQKDTLTEYLGKSEMNRGPKEAREQALGIGGGRALQ